MEYPMLIVDERIRKVAIIIEELENTIFTMVMDHTSIQMEYVQSYIQMVFKNYLQILFKKLFLNGGSWDVEFLPFWNSCHFGIRCLLFCGWLHNEWIRKTFQ